MYPVDDRSVLGAGAPPSTTDSASESVETPFGSDAYFLAARTTRATARPAVQTKGISTASSATVFGRNDAGPSPRPA
jgi:hypothetical protein